MNVDVSYSVHSSSARPSRRAAPPALACFGAWLLALAPPALATDAPRPSADAGQAASPADKEADRDLPPLVAPAVPPPAVPTVPNGPVAPAAPAVPAAPRPVAPVSTATKMAPAAAEARTTTPQVAKQGSSAMTLAAAHPLVAPKWPHLPGQRGIVLSDVSAQAQSLRQAERLLRNGEVAAAASLIQGQQSPSASLLQARAAIALGQLAPAAEALTRASAEPKLASYIALEQGRLALLADSPAAAVGWLWPLWQAHTVSGEPAIVPLAHGLAATEPNRLIALRRAFAARLAGSNADDHSQLEGVVAAAYRALGQSELACRSEVERFVAWPMAPSTPAVPPGCRPLSASEWLARIERLVDANRNQAAEQALADMRAARLPPLGEQHACQLAFFTGMVARKQHHYQAAEKALGEAAANCRDPSLERRARFTQAKVISIQDGLRALEPIEAFVKQYGSHSMVDDALFWAGDSLQRRGRHSEAAKYYERILALPKADDYCAEAAWRLVWMDYRRGEHAKAKRALERALGSHCVADSATRARAHYWLGRLAEQGNARSEALACYRRSMQAVPLHYYAQQSLARSLALASEPKRRALLAHYGAAPKAESPAALCPALLGSSPLLAEALFLREQGLTEEARAAALALDAHVRPAKLAQPSAPPHDRYDLKACGQAQASLLLVRLLDDLGAHAQARRRLTTDFAPPLGEWPTADSIALWRQAYPLAFRQPIAQAEQESGLPPYLLQALAREESGFDPEVISWAEAVGLTQLLLSSGQQAGRALRPPIKVPDIETLLEPHLNARLGGALLGLFGRQLERSWPLALAAYNGGFDTAKAWWQRFAGEEFAVFAEEMTVRETRLYVQRVLQTHGIYRWLYDGAPPVLDVEHNLPSIGEAKAKKS